MNFFNKNIDFLTKNTKINQNQLALKLGLTRQTINKLINQTTDPRASTLIKISQIYEISIDDLLLKDLTIE